jgi:pterin-4a-carbinolamine dehydratase
MKWSKKNNRLELTIQFKSQTELAEAFLKIAELADKSHHHPDAEIVKCSTLILTLFTHDSHAITEKDYQLAEKIEQLF